MSVHFDVNTDHAEIEVDHFSGDTDEVYLEVKDYSGFDKTICAVAIMNREQTAALILALQNAIAQMPR